MPTHVDLSEVVISHFNQTRKLHPEILSLDPDLIEELIDAVPDENLELICELKNLLKKEGAR